MSSVYPSAARVLSLLELSQSSASLSAPRSSISLSFEPLRIVSELCQFEYYKNSISLSFETARVQ